MGFTEMNLGYFEQGIQTLTKAAELCEAAGDTDEAGCALHLLIAAHTFRSDYERVLELKEDFLCAMEDNFHLRYYCRGLGGVSQACSHLGRWDEAVEIAQEALSTAQDYSDESMIAEVEVILSSVYTLKGEVSRAVEHAELAAARAPTPYDKAMTQMVHGYSAMQESHVRALSFWPGSSQCFKLWA